MLLKFGLHRSRQFKFGAHKMCLVNKLIHCGISVACVTNSKICLSRVNVHSFQMTRTCFSSAVMSGIQPTGEVHIGNYFGAISHWLELQEQDLGTNIFSIVDLHAITLPHKPQELRSNVFHLLSVLLACGINPEKSVIYQQSTVSEHCQLAWILSCLMPLSILRSLPEWKEKSQEHSYPHVGLCNYPVLQAADILLYRPRYVPVGEDQRKHLDIARNLCRRFNSHYNTSYFDPPEMLINESKSRIKSLTNPSNKMSKSDYNRSSRILLTDSNDVIAKKIQRATTDSIPVMGYDPENRAEVANLIHIYCACTGEEPADVGLRLENSKTWADVFKSQLTEALVEKFQPIRSDILRLESGERAELMKILEEGMCRAKMLAAETLSVVHDIVGLGKETRVMQGDNQISNIIS